MRERKREINKYWQIERPNPRNAAVVVKKPYPECHHKAQEQPA